jgi:hypothetical protein
MSRRATLPGADELFRRTSDTPEAPAPGAPPPGESVPTAATAVLEPLADEAMPPGEPAVAEPVRSSRPTARRRAKAGDRRPTGRERHDEKITVYVSPEELVDIEQAKLVLRAQHGLAVDRGRIVREAVAVVIADLDAKGDESILVRRLRGV